MNTEQVYIRNIIYNSRLRDSLPTYVFSEHTYTHSTFYLIGDGRSYPSSLHPLERMAKVKNTVFLFTAFFFPSLTIRDPINQ